MVPKNEFSLLVPVSNLRRTFLYLKKMHYSRTPFKIRIPPLVIKDFKHKIISDYTKEKNLFREE